MRKPGQHPFPLPLLALDTSRLISTCIDAIVRIHRMRLARVGALCLRYWAGVYWRWLLAAQLHFMPGQQHCLVLRLPTGNRWLLWVYQPLSWGLFSWVSSFGEPLLRNSSRVLRPVQFLNNPCNLLHRPQSRAYWTNYWLARSRATKLLSVFVP